MATTLRAVFDGTVLRPEQPLDLRVGATYVVTIQDEVSTTTDAPTIGVHPLAWP